MALSLARAVPRRLGQLSAQSRVCSLRPRLSPTHAWAGRGCVHKIGSATVQQRNYADVSIPQTGGDVNSIPSSTSRVASFAMLDTFPRRHIGPDDAETAEMLKALSPPVRDLDDFVSQVLPPDIRAKSALGLTGFIEPSESGLREQVRVRMQDDFARKSFIGQGYYEALTPAVIKRNVLENPAWYTSYTPYQPEISQGRLESLVNFQTMVSDLTGLPIANASLLDEGTAAAEAMTLSMNALSSSRAKRPGKTYVVSTKMHPQTISVMRGRAEGFGITLLALDPSKEESLAEIKALGDDLVGVMVQYPDTYGSVDDHKTLAELVHEQGALLSVATDLLALTMLKPPGEWGADVAFGSAQRFGIPLGFGGPHAAFFSVTEKHKRKIPGRLVGLSKDRMGRNAYRLALQTREQHIRREKATSNVCTSQALLANMSALYAIYHGPRGLKAIAERTIRGARAVQAGAKAAGFHVVKNKWDEDGRVMFDTVVVDLGTSDMRKDYFKLAKSSGFYVRRIGQTQIGVSVDEATTHGHLALVVAMFRNLRQGKDERGLNLSDAEYLNQLLSKEAGPVEIPEKFRRTSPFMTHPVFNTHHSETEMLRYIYHLQSKDLSLVHSMIPLGSCTMKLNGTTEMSIFSLFKFANVHPYVPLATVRNYLYILKQFSEQLAQITGMDKTSLQPNSGAQGEFAGLRTIREYHKANKQPDEKERDICLIPVSAHGTNPASAAMAGMRVVPIKCNSETGNLDIADLEAKCKQYQDQLGAIMVTYPSTFGVFEPEIKKVCQIVHDHGGQVYMDGANMNAQIGLCSPGEIGADVCHLNLHKTFCIPHGGGGPGVGPICVKNHLAEFLPGNPNTSGMASPKSADTRAVSSALYGSASINLISWAYNTMMGGDGLTHATKITLLNANYLLSRLKPHYPILYVNENGRCAHEFILDTRPFSKSAGVEAIDIAKRLQDYGFHAPTMSWPVSNTLMIEPTESESKEELDRFVDALISIREEIREIEEGKIPREGNVLKNAPHPMQDFIEGDGDGNWERSYSRAKAAYPLPWLREKKFWPSVARVDDTYGDLNLFCTCPPVEDTTGDH